MAVIQALSTGRAFRLAAVAVVAFALGVVQAVAAPKAAYVIDARTGKVLYSQNADRRLHPASLTKMMTLYIAFQAIERGEISLDTLVTVSRNAASEPPSKLGLRPGQKIKLRYLIRAAAIKSANDCATAIGEAISGSEAAFARRMNRTAKQLGMTRTTFKNANGLTESGHLSTAHDMTILGRHLLYDHPQYYNLFSRRSSDAGGRKVYSTNRRFLNAYKGADGIKTGYTVASGFNLVASAERGNKRIIATVFGGTSTAARNARAMKLLDLGFRKAPSWVKKDLPTPPAYAEVQQSPVPEQRNDVAVALAEARSGTSAAKTLRVSGAPTRSLRPPPRPVTAVAAADVTKTVADVLAEVKQADAATAPTAAAPQVSSPAPPRPATLTPAAADVAEATKTAPETQLAEAGPVTDMAAADGIADALAAATANSSDEPDTAPATDPAADSGLAAADNSPDATDEPAVPPGLIRRNVPAEVFPKEEKAPVVVSRLSTSGGRNWGINVGTYPSSYVAQKVLLKTALIEIGTLDDALRKVARGKRGFEANFLGMTQDTATLACQRLSARSINCRTFGPNG